MGKRIVSIGDKQKKKAALARLQKDLGEGCACFVLITCTEPTADGKMQVELDFEGDEDLASFLIESATRVFEERDISDRTLDR
jgi:hypothetical protein